jgi:ELWxxDGT repeat protein
MLLGDENRLWFAAEEATIGLEVMQLDSDGIMTMYDLHPFGDSSPSDALTSNNSLIVAAGDGTGRQLAHLDGSGGLQWLTSMTKEGTTTPVTTLAPAFGLHQIGDAIIFDVVYRGADATLFSYSLSTSNLVELSSTILAPGHSLESVTNGHTIWFDCVLATTGMELCQTDGTVQGTYLTIDLMQGISSSLPKAMMYTDSTLYVLAQGIDETGTNSGHALWSIDNQVASIAFDPYTGIGNNSNAGTYGGLMVSSTHVFFIADDGIHGHELHQYLLPAIQDQWMVWD